MSGVVYLVGAGPGDPGLLTRKAERLLREADVIVIDALVSPEIRALIPASTRVVEAGKRASKHTLSQDEINQLLVDEAQAGRRVVRLKGGDPFVFGRGGEEAERLVAAGVTFEIVPGISSSIAGPAYAGIPVTHRSLSTSFTVVTAHESDESSGVDWSTLAATRGTLVLLMGLAQLEQIASKLIAHGMPATTRIAVVSHATTPRQKSIDGTLENIAERVAQAALTAPALIVVGEVVSLRETLGWFERRPLFGKTIVVTRAREQASRFAEMLEDRGARALQFPTIEIAPPSSFESLDELITARDRFDWIVFTSNNGVDSFFQRLAHHGLDARALAGRRIAAVGKPTAAALERRGIVADVVPERFQSQALLPHLPADLSGVSFGVVRALRGNDDFLADLRARGARVHLAVAYETKSSTQQREELAALLQSRAIDAVTFTSGSTVENFFAEFERMAVNDVVLASIGPQTSAALASAAGRVDVEADRAEIDALRDALVRHFTR